ncbi:efflux RND transporter periplasmic adaptor subunit [Aureimonas sp. ME7]|uniref:efflux RND transporter periplasmic adaptor subunit n=1 Tax=Aureimonas sp. ME7 TaxID=2744252 RepID=UPI0015F53677|nr:efflux RND transporter periplasmic adaptor subunit [Aureimonas sp. ME7]
MAFGLRRVVAVLLAVGAGAGIYAAVQGGAEPSGAAVIDRARPPAGPTELASFEVATVERRAFTRDLSVSGPVQPVRRAVITAEVSGRIASLGFDVGQRVEAGDVLARFDETLLRSTLSAREATLEARRAQIELAQSVLERRRKLGTAGISSEADLLSAQSDLLNLQAQARALEAEVADARKSVGDAVVVAPFAGTMAKREVEAGQSVPVNAELLQLVDLSSVEIAAAVPTSRIAEVAIGQAVNLRIEGLGGRTLIGRVSRIAPEAVAGSRTISVFVTVDNADGAIRGGMFAVGEIAVQTIADAVALPPAAIRQDEAGTYVLAAEGGKLVRRPVRTGETLPQSGLVVVAEGLEAGEVVVTAPLPDLKADTAVVIEGAA